MENLLNLENAKLVSKYLEKIIENDGKALTITIVNKWGYPILLHFMEGAIPISINLSFEKAKTSALIEMSTKSVRDLSKSKEFIGIDKLNGVTSFSGGFPIVFEQKVIGAIGVSGNTDDYDNKISFIGKRIFEEVLRCKMDLTR